MEKMSTKFEPRGSVKTASSEMPSLNANYNDPIETLFTESSLRDLKMIFQKGPMKLDRFTNVLTGLFGLDVEYAARNVPNLFNAVDTYRKGYIHFTDLCQYLYEDYQKRDMWMGEHEKMNLVTPGRVIAPKIHRPLPVKMLEVDDLHMMFSKDGMVSYWSNSFKLRKCKSLKTREKERQYGKVYCDISVVESIGKVIVSTSDKEIQFFDLQSLEPYCQIYALPSCACSIEGRMSSQNVLIIVFGDWNGAVNVIAVKDSANTFRNWSERPKVTGIAAVTLEIALARKEISMARWKVHERRVDKVIYTELLGGQVISCSTDPNAALSIGCAFPPFSEHVNTQFSVLSTPKRPPGEEQVYKIPFGIQTIDVWEEKRFLAASGVDCIIRIWNVMTRGDAIATLRGHIAPVRQIKFFPPVLVSISSQKSIRIWDLKEFRVIIVVNPVISKIRGQDVFFMHCSKMSSALVVQTNEDLYAFQLQKKTVDNESEATHSGPVVAGEYNHLLGVWITCSDALVKVWDIRTGRKKTEFSVSSGKDESGDYRINEELRFRADEAIRRRENRRSRKTFIQPTTKYYPDINKPSDVTSMYVDRMGNRLLTGHANGIVQEFNFVSGMKIRTMCKPRHTREEVFNTPVNSVIYVRSSLNDNILSVGWDKVIDVYTGGDSKNTEPVTSWLCYKGHEDDIWCITSAEPNILATGSFEGLTILWNFTSGKIEGRLLPPNFDPATDYDMKKVTSLSIYKANSNSRDGTEAMYLFSAGPQSGMHMWEIYWKIKSFFYRGKIRPWRSPVRYFTNIRSASEQKVVVAADNIGYVYVYDMKDIEAMKGLKYNQRGYEFNEHLIELIKVHLPEVPLQEGITVPGMPGIRKSWLAHATGIPVLVVCDPHGLMLTGDVEGKARVWNMSGTYIGMLGQETDWDIQNPDSYKNKCDFPEEDSRGYDNDYSEHGSEPTDISAVVSVDNSEEMTLTDEEVRNRSRGLILYKRILPDFLQFENCNKVVYRNSLYQQKYSLTPVYKRIFDSELMEGLPKSDS